LPIVYIIEAKDYSFKIFFLLLFLLFFGPFVILSGFKTYLCLDISNRQLIVRNFGLTYDKINLLDIEEFKLSDGTPETPKDQFTIDVKRCGHYTKKYRFWSQYGRFAPIFVTNKVQRKRLNKFVDICNEYISNMYNTNFGIEAPTFLSYLKMKKELSRLVTEAQNKNFDLKVLCYSTEEPDCFLTWNKVSVKYTYNNTETEKICFVAKKTVNLGGAKVFEKTKCYNQILKCLRNT